MEPTSRGLETTFSAVVAPSATLKLRTCQTFSIQSSTTTSRYLQVRVDSGAARKFFRQEKIQRVFPSALLPSPPPYSVFLSSHPLFSHPLPSRLLPCPFPFPFPLSFSSPFPPISPLRSRTPKIQLGGLGRAVSPGRNRMLCIIVLKYEIW